MMKNKLVFCLVLVLAFNAVSPFILKTSQARAGAAPSPDEVDGRMMEIEVRVRTIQRLRGANTADSLRLAQQESNELAALLIETLGYLKGMRAVRVQSKTAAARKAAGELELKIQRLEGYRAMFLPSGAAPVAFAPSAAATPPTLSPDVVPSPSAVVSVAAASPTPAPSSSPPSSPSPSPTPSPTPAPTPELDLLVPEVPEDGDKSLKARAINIAANKLKKPVVKFFVGEKEVGNVALSPDQNDSNEISVSLADDLERGQTVVLRLLDDTTEKKVVRIDVFGKIDPTEGDLFGAMGGGVVTSRQAQTVNEAAPFTFFQVGYGSRIRGITRETTLTRNIEIKGSSRSVQTIVFDSLTCKLGRGEADEGADTGINATGIWTIEFNTITSPDRRFVFRRADDEDFDVNNNPYRSIASGSLCTVTLDRHLKPFTGLKTSRWSFRFQGLFSNEGRAATATPTGQQLPPGQPNRPFPFINHQQSFSTEVTLWREYRPLAQFSYGFYGTVGFTTLLESTVKENQLIFDRESNQRVLSRVVTPGGTKFYGEIGAVKHLKFNPGRFLVQNFAGFGYYEAYRNAMYRFNDTPGAARELSGNTRFRFVDKLRVFPFGYDPNFGRQITAAPMFGVDFNMGAGPDNVRFFTGFVINLGRFTGETKEK